MSTSVSFEVEKLPTFEVHAWRADVVRRLTAGQRLVTLFGRREGDEVLITAVFQAGSLEVTRTSTKASVGYSELTSSFGALHCFERELHEQTGLHFAAHPWLKPIRFQGRDQAAMSAYPYYRIDGKEVHEVAVGPIHAGVIEPGSFRFMCMGEQVHHLEIQLGYQHRGLEPRLLVGDPRRLTPLVETIAGDTTIGHAWAFCAALEKLAGCELDEDTELARAFVLELERVAMHLAGLAGLAADVGFLQGASTYGRLRTTAINTTMRLCGSRFGRSALRPGGLGMKLPAELVELVSKNVELLRTDLEIINELFVTSQTVRHRLEGVGVLKETQAKELGVVGLAARASGLVLDARTSGVWKRAPIPSVVLKDGDCQARAQLRIAELDESLAWLAGVLARGPRFGGPRKPVGPLAPRQLVVSVVEGWRGEVVHCLETGPTGALVHAKVQDPSLRNWMGLAIAVRGNEISDFPICNKSFDLSYCGNDL
ncbi:MAG: hydrogenase [Archangium sp.]|nr:hydrogenase [Archangium sp.]